MGAADGASFAGSEPAEPAPELEPLEPQPVRSARAGAGAGAGAAGAATGEEREGEDGEQRDDGAELHGTDPTGRPKCNRPCSGRSGTFVCERWTDVQPTVSHSRNPANIAGLDALPGRTRLVVGKSVRKGL